ncbi:MAG: hypothetical protein R3F12_01240 [Lysobacteraceae bacterium]
MPRNLSVRLGDVTRLPLAQHPLYSAIETELGPGRVSVSRASPWVGAALGAALLLPGIAGAATITVDSTDWTISTDGNCTMPEAVANANANADTTGGDCAAGAAGLDEIQFDASLIGSTINVDSPLTVVANEPLDVVGPGTRDQLVFDGGGNNRFMVAADDVSLSNITAQHFFRPWRRRRHSRQLFRDRHHHYRQQQPVRQQRGLLRCRWCHPIQDGQRPRQPVRWQLRLLERRGRRILVHRNEQ